MACGSGDPGGDETPAGAADGGGDGTSVQHRGASPDQHHGASAPEAVTDSLTGQDGESPVAVERDATLVVVVRRLPTTLDPLAELDPWGQRIVDDLVFEGLTVRGGDQAPFVEPAIADTCLLQIARVATHVYCRLRADVSFHDGTRVTADDVLASLELWTDPRRSSLRQRHGLAGLKRVELAARVPADATIGVGSGGTGGAGGTWVHVEFAQQEPLALERIAAMKIVPKAKRRAAGFGRAPIGTGPMRVRAFDGERLELERATASGRREAGTQVMRFELVPDGAAALVRMRRGDVHVLADVAPGHVPRELGKPGMAARFTAWRLTPPRWDLVFFNVRRGFTAKLELRAALDRALPRMALATALDPMPPHETHAPVDVEAPVEIDLAALAAAKAAADWGAFGLPARVDPARDEVALADARTALAKLGWRIDRGSLRKSDDALRIVLMWDHAAGASTTTANALRRGWRELGVQMPQVTASFAYLLGLMQKGEFDVALGRLATRSNADLHPYFHSKGALNVPGIADAELDRALEDYRSAPTTAQRDDARARIAARISAVVPVGVLFAPTEIMLVSRRVVGLAFDDDLPRLDALALAPASAFAAND